MEETGTRWKQRNAAKKQLDRRPVVPIYKLGSYAELFRNPVWRKNAIVGVLLASAGVIGLWGIGFFSFDLNRTVFRNVRREAPAKNG